MTVTIHLISASVFFILLAINSLFLFTKSRHKVIKHSRKWYRNVFYKVCGIVILISLIALIPAMLFAHTGYPGSEYSILLLETVMLFAFGISWLVKGGTLLMDKRATES